MESEKAMGVPVIYLTKHVMCKSIVAMLLVLTVGMAHGMQLHAMQPQGTPQMLTDNKGAKKYSDNEFQAVALKNVLSVDLENVTLEQGLNTVARKAGLKLVYSTNIIPAHKRVSLQKSEMTLENVLWALLAGTGLRFGVSSNNHLVIMKWAKEDKKPVQQVQAETVSGTVTDAQTGETLPGVNILVKGTSTGASTDADGQYELTVESLQDTLVVSFVGYKTQQVPIDGRTEINVALQTQAISGEEMVVTALGIEEKQRNLTYSTQTVSTEEITQARELNPANSLSGKVAGLSVTKSGAGVGSPSRVILRGNRSITGSNNPLIVVDGVPTSGGLSSVNPDNIESLNVLKGANSAALYGSEAQNGVIIVTTKKGRRNEVEVDLHSSFMMRKPHMLTNFQNTYGQGSGGEYIASSSSSWGARMEGQMVDQWSKVEGKAGTKYAYKPRTNNNSDIYRNGYNLASGFTASFGNESSTAFISYTNTLGKGVVPNNNLERHNATLRVNSQLTPQLTVDAKLSYNNEQIDNKLYQGQGTNNPNHNIYRLPRSLRLQDVKQYTYTNDEGIVLQNSWTPGQYAGSNPYWLFNRDVRQNSSERVRALASATYNFTDALSLLVRADYNGNTDSNQRNIYNGNYAEAPDGYFEVGKNRGYNVSGDVLLSYKHSFSQDWSLDVSAGGDLNKSRNNGLSSNTGLFEPLSVPNLFTLSNTQNVHTSYDYGSPSNKQSLYGLAKVGWKNAIFLNVTGRNEWSSTLPKDSRSYFYPSVGLSAVISDIIDLPDFLSFAKVRGSYAIVGSSASPFLLSRFANFSKGGKNGFMKLGGTLPANNLKPEETKSYEVGVQVQLFENRVGLDVTAYKTNTTNQLFNLALPVGSGASNFYTNGGDVQNKGLEFELTSTPVQTKHFVWDVGFNFSMNRNKVNKIYQDRDVLTLTSSELRAFRVKEGEPFGDLYSRGFVRDDQGRVIVNSNGIPKLTKGQSVKVANFNPNWNAGLSSRLSYKNYSLHFLIDRRQGGSVVSFTEAWMAYEGVTKRTLPGREGGAVFGKDIFSDEVAVNANGSQNNTPVDVENFWKIMGGRSNQVGEAFVEDATSMRLRELTISYSLPSSVINRLPISELQLSLTGRNLFFIYNASNLDPDMMSGTGAYSMGKDSFAPPNPRRFGASIRIGL